MRDEMTTKDQAPSLLPQSHSRLSDIRPLAGLADILPVALLLSQFVPWLLTPILMVGALYLAYEGAEKVYTALRGHDTHTKPPADEGSVVAGAIRTLPIVKLAGTRLCSGIACSVGSSQRFCSRV